MPKRDELKPFWSYYGAKWQHALLYPAPNYATIVEPFAGAAGYSLRYYRHQIVLSDSYPVISELWKYLIRVSSEEIRRIPLVDAIADLPKWVPPEARSLVGFALNEGAVSPRKTLSAGLRRRRDSGDYKSAGWSANRRDRIASQVEKIRHWRVTAGGYSELCNKEATWFVDPPYDNAAGALYVKSQVDYADLAVWCKQRRGQVIVCENQGATWLPFRHHRNFGPGYGRKAKSEGGSSEVIWTQEDFSCLL